MIVNIHCRCII